MCFIFFNFLLAVPIAIGIADFFLGYKRFPGLIVLPFHKVKSKIYICREQSLNYEKRKVHRFI